jgi:hypothetical protein
MHTFRKTNLFHSGLLLLLLIGRGFAQRAIPDDNLAYPVLISLADNSSGSGFFLNSASAVYLVTAKHVLFKERPKQEINPQNPDPLELRSGKATLVCYSKDPSDPTKNVFTLDLSALETAGNIKRNPTQDVVVVKMMALQGTMSKPFPGVTILNLAKAGILGVAPENVKTFNQTLTGNDVLIFGYPGSIGLQNLPQIDYQRPLLRKGIVAGTNPAQQSLILDCPAYHGNSGGPVVEIDREVLMTKFTIIGVVIQLIPFNQTEGSDTIALLGNSGYSVAAPMDFVLELLK